MPGPLTPPPVPLPDDGQGPVVNGTSAVNPPKDGNASKRVIELPPPPRPVQPAARSVAPDNVAPAALAGPPPATARSWAIRPDLAISYLCSFAVHFGGMLLLAFVFQVVQPEAKPPELLVMADVGPAPEAFDLRTGSTTSAESHDLSGEVASPSVAAPPLVLTPPLREPTLSQPGGRAEGVASPVPQPLAVDLARRADLMTPAGAKDGGASEAQPSSNPLDISGRGDRGSRAVAGGGTPGSESAVERGLRWLQVHQHSDGGWRFDLSGSHCQGQCKNAGDPTAGKSVSGASALRSTTAATALALLPFLGAGYTDQAGEFQDTIQRALYYLQQRALITPQGADLQEGTLYAQGLATLALCEAYAMTKRSGLGELAQKALNFTVAAQDRNRGGWRYRPGVESDTTVTGWQVLALKSGLMAGLNVPSPTFQAVMRYFDSVQSDEGSQYGYMGPVRGSHTTTAIGLLSRMYLGWAVDRPALVRGMGHLVAWGPAENDIYYNYYATQVLHHGGGGRNEWKAWNNKIREHLVRTQSKAGHEAGSWHFADGSYGDRAGRLYSTAMAIMTLEVYYRYLPLYRPGAANLRP